MASVDPKWINEILRTVVGMTPDGDAQLTILVRALVVGCRSCSVDRDTAVELLGSLFDQDDMRLAPLEAVDWQPIETAPKDGTEVLVYVRRRLGAIYAGASNPTGTQWWSRNLGDLQPTHWMPLPPKPED